jgi:tRNA-dihydrouridine synthase
MKFYFAPMEGITGYIFRNAHKKYFGSIAKYFTPFISPNNNTSLNRKELKDVLPENNPGICVVPQILTNNAEDFINTSAQLCSMGYSEVNINLGCPSGTVVAKNKGSGFLAQRDRLDSFLDSIYSRLDMKVSVKTRIGKDSHEEFYELINIYNKYPISELIIHPRIQKDQYKNKPDLDIFRASLTLSTNPVCYNGDIFTADDCKAFCDSFPNAETVMLGRGAVTNPALADEICGKGKLSSELLKNFHDEVYENYRRSIQGDINVLYRMKEFWHYAIQMFSDNAKYAKAIRKAQKLKDYEAAVSSLFKDREIADGNGYRP